MAVVDLPTPPLPLAMAMMCLTPGTMALAWPCGLPPGACRGAWDAAPVGAPVCAPAVSAVRTAVAESTPDRPSTAFSAALRSGSSCGPRLGSTSMAKKTLPSLTVKPLIIPAETRSFPLAESTTFFRASSTAPFVTSLILDFSAFLTISATSPRGAVLAGALLI